MISRKLFTAIGATALGLGIVVGGTPGTIQNVFAQEVTPTAVGASVQTDQTQDADIDVQRAEAYDAFVAAMASELGSDEAAVDAAIRTALTQQVDDQLAAGEIGEERAAAAKAVIEVSDAPLSLGFSGRGGMHGSSERQSGHGRDGGDDRGQPDDRDSQDKTDASASLPADRASN